MRLNANDKIIGQKVVLVPYEKEHVDKYHRWMEDPELREQTASERLSVEEEYEMQRKWREDEDKLTFIILDKKLVDDGAFETDAMVGDTNLFLTDSNSDDGCDAEVEVMIAEREARSRGLAAESVRLLISYALERLSVRKFFAKISASNTASLGLFTKLHFTRESYSAAFDEHTLRLDTSGVEELRPLITSTASLIPYRSFVSH